jgi:hypothetical protein
MLDRTTSGFGEERSVLIRLTALWALNEAALGGLMHLFRSPFTGIFVGGSAVLLITLIAYVAKRPGPAILQALLIVLIIKGTVSPHSPLPAYFAVGFQGLMGALLFSLLPSFRLAALLLGGLALLESALQKLLVTTLLFGMPIWQSIDVFIDYVLKKMGVLAAGSSVQGSLWLVGLYVGTYALSGLAVGWLAGRLPQEVKAAAQELELPELADAPEGEGTARKRRPIWQRPSFLGFALLLLFFVIVYFSVPAAQGLLAPVWLILRTLAVIAIWYFVLSPLLMRLLKGFLHRKAAAYRADVNAALAFFPAFRKIARAAWQETRQIQGWRRWKTLAVRIIAYALMVHQPTKSQSDA